MPDTPTDVHVAVSRRWRFRLVLVITLLGLGALVATIMAVAYRESATTSVLLWLGLGALVLGLRQLPRAVTPAERPRMAASAAWVVAGIVIYFVVPVVLAQT